MSNRPAHAPIAEAITKALTPRLTSLLDAAHDLPEDTARGMYEAIADATKVYMTAFDNLPTDVRESLVVAAGEYLLRSDYLGRAAHAAAVLGNALTDADL